MNGISHIIWDWNGTLLDDIQASVNVINALLQERQLPGITREHYLDIFGFPVRNFYNAIGLHVDEQEWQLLAHEFHQRFVSDPTLRLHSDATAILDQLRSWGVTQTILSASHITVLQLLLQRFGIERCFDHIFGVQNFDGASKIDLGHRLMGELDLNPESTLLVGDSIHDHEVATELGIHCILLDHGHQAHNRLANRGVPLKSSLSELQLKLEGITTRQPPE